MLKKGISEISYTNGLLVGDKKVLDSHPEDPDTMMFWVVCCVSFFAFLHSAELTVSNSSGF